MTNLFVRAFLLVVGLVGATVSATPTSECAYTNYRLPKHIVPKHYDLQFNVDTQKYEYSGEVTVNIKVDRKEEEQVPHHMIVLNVHRDVEVSGVTYIDIRAGHSSQEDFTIGYTSVDEICRDNENELLVIKLGENLAHQAEGQLTMLFSGKIREDNTGIHKTKHRSRAGVDSYVVSTDFQPNKARRAFPCFDEPSFRATFTIELDHDRAEVALANTGLFSQSIRGDRIVSIFKKSPLMSIHLVTFAIGKFEYIEKTALSGWPKIRAYTPVGKSHQAQFALDTAVEAFTHLEQYFGLPLPLEKIDLLSEVGHNRGVRGNWGLIVFNETLLLFDDENSLPINKGYVAQTVVRGLSQQWFGNLVTLEWWNDIWLQEGFNTWVGYNLTNYLYPTLQWEQNYLIEAHSKALDLDSQGDHQIAVANVGKDNIDGILDELVRLKSTAIIKFLHDVYVEPDKFKVGIRLYMKTNKYGNTEASDLWDKLQAITKLPVGRFITSWTQQSGHPLLMVSKETGRPRQQPTRKLTLLFEQKRHRLSSVTGEHEQINQVWIMPVTVLLSDGRRQPEARKFYLDKERTIVDLPEWFDYRKDGHWMKVNDDFRGFYHVQYSAGNLLHRLKNQLLSKAEVLSTSNRIGLLNDFSALYRSDLLTIKFPFTELLHWYKKEIEGVVLGQLFHALSLLQFHSRMIVHLKRSLLMSAYDRTKLSSEELRNAGSRNGMGVMDCRGLVAMYSNMIEVYHISMEPLVDEALALFDKGGNKIAPIIRELVYKVVTKYGSDDQMSELQSFRLAPNICLEEKNRLDVAFGINSKQQDSLRSSSSAAHDSQNKRKRSD